jgi:osmotically inducible lipoprotein OsmB
MVCERALANRPARRPALKLVHRERDSGGEIQPGASRGTHTINLNKDITMNSIKNAAVKAAAILMVVGLSACSGMSTNDRNTAIGAGAGAVTGAVLTGGSAVGTVGGAAVGGYIGNQINK